MRTFGSKLSAYEHTEIYNYPRVYFVGSQAKKRGGLLGAPSNCGYDDENGSYVLVAHDHVAYRYEVLKVIGKGSFGQVSEGGECTAIHFNPRSLYWANNRGISGL